MEPAIAVGGFLSPGQDLQNPPYEKATAIILTILVNNYHNKAKLLPAMEWEERYICVIDHFISKILLYIMYVISVLLTL